MADPTGPGIVDGTETDDIMDVGFTDGEGDAITDGGDVISAQDGDDDVQGGAGDDTIFGGNGSDTLRGGEGDDIILGDEFGPQIGDGAQEGQDVQDEPGDDLIAGEAGNDTVFAGDGNDTIYGDYEPGTEPATSGGRESFNWSEVGTPADGDPLATSSVQDTGSVQVTYTSGTNTDSQSTFEDDSQLLTGIDGGGEAPNANSSLESETGSHATATYDLEFSESVENVEFRINDIDENAVVKVWAWDLEGNRIEVNLTGSESSNLHFTDIDGVAGNEAAISDGHSSGDSEDADNSVLVSIPGPVARLEIRHVNLDETSSDVTISDVFFDTVGDGEGPDADDLLIGGDGDDMIYGQEGDDTIVGMGGEDTMVGGDDQDTFILFGPGDMIDGSEGGIDFDTINLYRAAEDANPGGSLRIDYDPDNAENGTITFLDAEGAETGVATFINIENVIDVVTPFCFTAGTRILTPMGEICVEQLKEGDKVVTRDNGLQEIRWAGSKHLSGRDLMARPQLRPILIRHGALGPSQPERDMMVSPSHRMLLVSQQAELLFDESEVLVAAKHLTHLDGVDQIDTVGVDYIHIMCDNHEVVLADGAWSESFQPGEFSLNSIENAQRKEIYDLFPELKEQEGLQAYSAARLTLKRHEAQLLG